ncbi:putative reverse transcriptase domain-containing protein [Tanacetum coccineum]
MKSLATWGKDDGITTLVKSILDGDGSVSFGYGGGDFLKKGTNDNTNIRQCLRKVADGHFTAVVKVLSSPGVAPYCDDTIKALEAKNRYKPPPSMPSKTFIDPTFVAKIDIVIGCIKLFPKGTSCERDGLRAQHILDAICGEGSATVTDLLKAITSVINVWLAGRCSPILAGFVASAPLTPLLKPDNGIRPISVGTMWRRLVFKVPMKGVDKEMSKYFNDFQFGVKVSGGAEAILHSVNRLLSEYHNDGSLSILTMNFSNAFNLMDRSALLQEIRVRCPSISLWVNFLYAHATRLYIRDTYIWSTTEAQQGDPLGPILFALVLHPLVHKIRDCCKLLLHAWYLDNGTVTGDLEEVALGVRHYKGERSRPSLGMKLLEGAISRDVNFISEMAMRRAANAVDLTSLLSKTPPPLKPNKLASTLFSETVKDMKAHFDMTVRQKAVFEYLRALHAQDFLLAIPIDGLDQQMSPVEYRTILKYRLMIPLFPVDVNALFVARHGWITLGNMRFIVKSSHVLSTDTIWLVSHPDNSKNTGMRLNDLHSSRYKIIPYTFTKDLVLQ